MQQEPAATFQQILRAAGSAQVQEWHAEDFASALAWAKAAPEPGCEALLLLTLMSNSFVPPHMLHMSIMRVQEAKKGLGIGDAAELLHTRAMVHAVEEAARDVCAPCLDSNVDALSSQLDKSINDVSHFVEGPMGGAVESSAAGEDGPGADCDISVYVRLLGQAMTAAGENGLPAVLEIVDKRLTLYPTEYATLLLSVLPQSASNGLPAEQLVSFCFQEHRGLRCYLWEVARPSAVAGLCQWEQGLRHVLNTAVAVACSGQNSNRASKGLWQLSLVAGLAVGRSRAALHQVLSCFSPLKQPLREPS